MSGSLNYRVYKMSRLPVYLLKISAFCDVLLVHCTVVEYDWSRVLMLSAQKSVQVAKKHCGLFTIIVRWYTESLMIVFFQNITLPYYGRVSFQKVKSDILQGTHHKSHSTQNGTQVIVKMRVNLQAGLAYGYHTTIRRTKSPATASSKHGKHPSTNI